MSRKEFELIAHLLSCAKVSDTVIQIFAITLAGEYPRFDKEKFIAACKEVSFR